MAVAAGIVDAPGTAAGPAAANGAGIAGGPGTAGARGGADGPGPATLRRWRLRGAVALALLGLLGLDRAAGFLAGRAALSGLRAEAEASAGLRVAVLRAEVEKQRALPAVLALDPDLRAALAEPRPERIAALNRKLEALAAATQAAVIYALDRDGLTLAASNWRAPDSFVGSRYDFRPYFRAALRDGAAEHFALGTVSQRPGLYLSRRIDGPEGAAGAASDPTPDAASAVPPVVPLGVVVVKAEFDAVEAGWRQGREPVLVSDGGGIVLVTDEPAWRFLSWRPLDEPERERLREGLQFGAAPLTPLPFREEDAAGARLLRADPPSRPGGAGPFLAVRVPVPGLGAGEGAEGEGGSGWSLTLMAPAGAPVAIATGAARALALLLGALLLGLAALAWRRRALLSQERGAEAAMRALLESRVARRTAALQRAHDRMRAEMEERRRAEDSAARLREELGQANRLAVLGQVAAGVAHEVNGPLAAIRAYADNARLLLDRGALDTVRGNLGRIAAVTERLGAITGGLRGFARKAPGPREAVAVGAALEGTRLLLDHRLRASGVALEASVPEGLVVLAERVRLEQVLVNLLNNAVEALADRPDPRIRVRAEVRGEQVRILVADNGPGLPEAVRAALFIPFTTTRSNGLGLGLVISRDIAAELGGTLEAGGDGGADGLGGAAFVLTLRRAGPPGGASGGPAAGDAPGGDPAPSEAALPGATISGATMSGDASSGTPGSGVPGPMAPGLGVTVSERAPPGAGGPGAAMRGAERPETASPEAAAGRGRPGGGARGREEG